MYMRRESKKYLFFCPYLYILLLPHQIVCMNISEHNECLSVDDNIILRAQEAIVAGFNNPQDPEVRAIFSILAQSPVFDTIIPHLIEEYTSTQKYYVLINQQNNARGCFDTRQCYAIMDQIKNTLEGHWLIACALHKKKKS